MAIKLKTINYLFVALLTVVCTCIFAVPEALAAVSADIYWTDPVNVSVAGGVLTKTAGSPWGAGAASAQVITGDGAVEFSAIQTSKARMLGLSSTNIDESYATIGYAIDAAAGGAVVIFESGVKVGNFGTYQSGDILRIERIGSAIYYKRNGATFYTSAITSSGDLIADASLNQDGAAIEHAMIEGAADIGVPVANAGADQTAISGNLVTLDGTASSDGNGTIVDYKWVQVQNDPNDPVVALAGDTTDTPSFTAPAVDGITVLTFELTVTDNDGLLAKDSVNVTVSPALAVTTTTLPGATQGALYSQILAVINGTPPYTWSIATGGLPTGISLDTNTGEISGTPLYLGTTAFTVQVTDAVLDTATQDLSITVNPPSAAVPIDWTDLVNVSAVGGTLTKTGGGTWGAGAASTQSISGDGAVEFTANQTTAARMLGLSSSNVDAGYNTINYALEASGSGLMFVFENGVNQGNFGTYQSGDILSVERIGTLIFYKRNGVTFHTSSVPYSGTLIADASLNQDGAAIEDAKIVGAVTLGLPIADAGADQLVNEGDSVTLDGTGSTDSDGTVVGYDWVQTGGPTVTLTGAATANPSFTAPAVTSNTVLTFQLTVTDNDGLLATDSVSVTVHDTNVLPTANAGVDQTVNEGVTVYLNGTGSSDSDGTVVQYRWSQTAGPAVSVTGGNSSTASFTAPAVSTDTVVSFRLEVTDNDGGTATDTVAITVRTTNLAPVANAGSDQVVNEGDGVTLDGTASSDSDGVIVSYNWVQTGGPVVALTGAATATPIFTAPAVSAVTGLGFRLTVTDDDGSTAIDNVIVTVNPLLQITTANLPKGVQGVIYSETLTAVHGVTPYTWSIILGNLPSGLSLNTATGEISGTPTASGTSTFTVQVADQTASTATQALSITVDPPGTTMSIDWVDLVNTSAVGGTLTKTGGAAWGAGAASSQVISGDGAVEFTATQTSVARMLGLSSVNVNASYSTINYAINAAGNGTVLVFENGANRGNFGAYQSGDALRIERVGNLIYYKRNGVTFYTSTVPSSGDLIADASLNQDGAIIENAVIQGAAVAGVPVADAGPDQTVKDGDSVTLDGTGSSDSNGTIVAYSWVQTAGPTVALTGASTVMPNFTAPAVATNTVLTFQLTVTDNDGLTSADLVNVTVAPLIITTTSLANGTQGVAYSQMLAAVNGTPPYTWSIALGGLPAGLSLNASTGEINGTPTTVGTSDFTVQVSDATLDTTTQALSITVGAGSSAIAVTWVDLVNVDAVGGTLTKTGGGAWGAGAASSQVIAGDGAGEFTATQTNTARMLGLSSTNVNESYNTINYAIDAAGNGTMLVFENGTNRGNFGAYQSGDVLRIERVGATIYYKRNGVTFYTSTIPYSGGLVADASLNQNGAAIENAVIEGGM